ncbi:MAG: M23 family metallopeptidase [Clostridia bacterium]|nr:M23 family metallopeptidase [Clostridia bacterium]
MCLIYRGNISIYIALAHLLQGSISVKAGDVVKVGQPIAKIGSSGLSGYPHLHIQAADGNFDDSHGLPIFFDGKYPISNSIFIRD